LEQNRFPVRSLCCIDGIAFVVSVGVVIVLVAAIHLRVHKHAKHHLKMIFNDYFRTPSITNLLNSLSDLFFLISISLKASLPTKLLNSGGTSLTVMAFKMTVATSVGGNHFEI
jgi:hypothetical protein